MKKCKYLLAALIVIVGFATIIASGPTTYDPACTEACRLEDLDRRNFCITDTHGNSSCTALGVTDHLSWCLTCEDYIDPEPGTDTDYDLCCTDELKQCLDANIPIWLECINTCIIVPEPVQP